MPLPSSAIRLRQRVFGGDNVAPDGAVRHDRVVLSWVGVATFVCAIGGKVVLLDAWVPRGTSAPRVPLRAAHLAALRPDAVLLGHGHVDHAGDLPRVLRDCDAVLVAAADHLRALRHRVEPARTVAALPLGAHPGGRASVEVLDGVAITAVAHVHSALTLPDGGLPHPVVPRRGPRAPRRRPRLRDVGHLLRHLRDPGGTSVLYHLRADGGSLVWHDTAGPLQERAPEAIETLRSLPPTDVHVGAVTGPNQLSNGLRDPRIYVEAVRPRVFVPAHHDDWLPPLTAPARRLRRALEAELARVPAPRRPQLRYLEDPDDYLRPERLTFAR